MKYLLNCCILCFFLNCHSAEPKTDFQFKSRTVWSPEGTWYLTDPGTGQKTRKNPVFIFKKNNIFLDSSQSVCLLEKIESGEVAVTPSSPTPFIEFDKSPKLENCPNYMYAWDDNGMVILHSDHSVTKPTIHFGFAPSEVWQLNLYIDKIYRFRAWIERKKDVDVMLHPSEISFPVLNELKK